MRQIKILANERSAEALSDMLMDAGALSATIEDADAVAEPGSRSEYACGADACEPDVSSRCHYLPEFTPVRTIF